MLQQMNYGREVARMSNERLIVELLVQMHFRNEYQSDKLLCVDEELEERLVDLDESTDMAHIDCMLGLTSNLYEAFRDKNVDVATGTINYILKLLEKGGV